MFQRNIYNFYNNKIRNFQQLETEKDHRATLMGLQCHCCTSAQLPTEISQHLWACFAASNIQTSLSGRFETLGFSVHLSSEYLPEGQNSAPSVSPYDILEPAPNNWKRYRATSETCCCTYSIYVNKISINVHVFRHRGVLQNRGTTRGPLGGVSPKYVQFITIQGYPLS